ncbi:hypothetical protein [Mangrovibacterium sp.]|uniref:hypothetical protein n=1 Tax=Mangrovibacterium sp. TaxID=1961364 RepID=UPI003569DC30
MNKINQLYYLFMFTLILACSCSNEQKAKDYADYINPLKLTPLSFGVVNKTMEQQSSPDVLSPETTVLIDQRVYEYDISSDFEKSPKYDISINNLPKSIEVMRQQEGAQAKQFAKHANTIVSFNQKDFKRIIEKQIIGNNEVLFNESYRGDNALDFCLSVAMNTYSALKNTWLLVKLEQTDGQIRDYIFPIITDITKYENQRLACAVDTINTFDFTDIVISHDKRLYLFYEPDSNLIFDFFTDSCKKHPFFTINKSFNYIEISPFSLKNETTNYLNRKYSKEVEVLSHDFKNPYWLGTYNLKTSEITSKANTIYIQSSISSEYSALLFKSGSSVGRKYTNGYDRDLVRHADNFAKAETYLGNCNYYSARIICRNSIKELSDFVARTNDERIKNEGRLLLSEFQSLQFNALNGLDIYGNPPGWVPMVSYEINKAAFTKEIEYASNAIFINYVLGSANNSLQEEIKKIDDAIKKLKSENSDLENEDAKLLSKIESDSTLLVEMKTLQTTCKNQISELARDLHPNAKRNVTKRAWGNMISFVAKTVASVAVVVPGGQIVAAVAVGVSVIASTVADIDIDDPLSLQNIELVAANAGELAESIEQVANSIPDEEIEASSSIVAQSDSKALKNKKHKELAENTTKYAGCVKNSLDNTVETVRAFQQLPGQVANNKKVEEELKKLLSANSDHNKLTEQLKKAVDSALVICNSINEKLSTYWANENKIQRNLEILLLKDRILSEDKSALSPAEKLTIENLKNASMKRLFEYHYLMAKAYEYRLIESFPEDNVNVEEFVGNVQKTIQQANGKFDESVLEKSSILFNEIIQKINFRIISHFNSGGSLLSSDVIYYSLNKSEINQINAGKTIELNLYEKENLFPPNEENLRLVDLSVASCSFSNDHFIHANQNNEVTLEKEGSNYINLNFIHSGISTLQKDGRLYKFNHLSSDKHDPVCWESHIDLIGNDIQTESISNDSKSLLLDASGKDTQGDLSLFSTPGVNADIRIKPWFNSPAQFKSIVVKITYDSQKLSSSFKTLKFYSNIDIPELYYNISAADINGLQHSGSSQFQRCYPQNKEIKIETFDNIQGYQFDHWESYTNGKWERILSDSSSSLKISINDHQIIKAIFKEI